MDKQKKIVVTLEQEGLRVDTFLSSFFHSRSQAEQAIKRGMIKQSSKQSSKQIIKSKRAKEEGDIFVIKKASYKVKAGEIYFIPCPKNLINKGPLTIEPYSFPVPILFEDEHLLVINKASGLPVHIGPGHQQDTLVNVLFHKTTLSSGGDPLRPGIVHRLDKDVSGLMILSKTKKAEKLLIEQFKNKKVHRLYRALIVGAYKEIPSPIISFIGRHPRDRKKFCSFEQAKADRKKSITHFRWLKSFRNKIHLMECQLETGRTHQIRVQVKSRGWPILGDSLYFPPRQQEKSLKALGLKKELFSFKGLALYSAKLKFFHPVYKKPLQFDVPWPKEFHPLLHALGFLTKEES